MGMGRETKKMVLGSNKGTVIMTQCSNGKGNSNGKGKSNDYAVANVIAMAAMRG